MMMTLKKKKTIKKLKSSQHPLGEHGGASKRSPWSRHTCTPPKTRNIRTNKKVTCFGDESYLILANFPVRRNETRIK
ncbi:hypothetical protein HanLR1_Chr05g0179961 [Helianthus annuus]|nr:hypothetical protein HanHA89_Chr05g0190551 [Helianthus annuus]KAJ0750274.1 hypothetical protein HanLR1_Chr05g0179961 [Helianthus annuus]